MAIYREDIADIELTSGTLFRSFMNHTIGSGDAKANRFGVRLFRDGEPVSAESVTVAGLFIAPNGTRYVISETSYPGSTGTEGNKAYVQLPGICYAVTGQFTLAIKLTGGGVEGTMRIVDGIVTETGEEGAVVPTSTIPATADIIAAYEEAVEVIGVSVRFDAEQSLSDGEKETARENIGAAGVGQVVRVDEEQTLSNTQKATARENIGATSDEDFQDIKNNIEYLSMQTRNLVDVFNANITNLFPNTATGKLSENDSVRSIIIPVNANLGETLAFYKGINSRFTVSTFSTTIIEAGTTYVTNTNFGSTATSGTITIDSTIKAVLVWYWYNDSADTNDVLESLTVVYGSTPVFIRSRIPYRDDYAPRKIEDISQDFNSDINLQTGSTYINSSDGPVAHAPLGLTEGAFYITNSSAVAVRGRRAVLQRCYIQSPVYLRTTIWYRFIDAATKTVYVDWNCTNSAWFNPYITIFGDSITAGYPQSSNDSYHWWAYLKRYFEFTNFAQSGAGIIFVNNNKSGTIFADNFNDETQNHLVIFMGTNDYGNDMPLGTVDDPAGTSTVCAGLRYIIETVMNTVPTISIIGILPLNRSDYGTAANNWAYGTANNAGYTLGELCDALKAIYESYGIPVIDNRQSVFQKLNMNALTGDGLHPNVNGYRKLSQHLGGEILKIIAPI